MSRFASLLSTIAALLLLPACPAPGGGGGDDDDAAADDDDTNADDDDAVNIEGDQAGECSDGADNDGDGDYDCDDSDCAGAPDCQGDDDDSTPPDDDDTSSDCDPGYVQDCDDECAPEDYIGDDSCDDGVQYPDNFNCAEFNFDDGDCDGDKNPDNGDFVVVWGDDTGYEDYSTWLQSASNAEVLADGLNASLRLPMDLPLIHDVCGMVNAYYAPAQHEIHMCYELVDAVNTAFWSVWGSTDSEPLIGQAVIQTYWFVLFHEVGHALVDYYVLPVTGSEEDAVDEFSSVLLIEAGAPDAVISAAHFWYLTDTGAPTWQQLADTHGLNMQRMYNMLCWVYGSDPATYASLLDTFPDLAPRAPGCQAEYEQKVYAWETLLAPWAQ